MSKKKFLADVGHAIKVERTKKRLTQKELAEKIGVSATYLSLIENRDRYPSEKILRKIAEGLETTQSKIIEEAKAIKRIEDSDILEAVKDLLAEVNIEDLKKAIEMIEKEL